VILNQILLGWVDQMEEDEIDGEFSTHRRQKNIGKFGLKT